MHPSFMACNPSLTRRSSADPKAPEEDALEARLGVEQVPRQRTAHAQPGYRVTFHTSARPMAGTNSQVRADTPRHGL